MKRRIFDEARGKLAQVGCVGPRRLSAGVAWPHRSQTGLIVRRQHLALCFCEGWP